jgi:hypothetical protein
MWMMSGSAKTWGNYPRIILAIGYVLCDGCAKLKKKEKKKRLLV